MTIPYGLFRAVRFVTSLVVAAVMRPDFIARRVAIPLFDDPQLGFVIQIVLFALVFGLVFGFLTLFKPRKQDSGEQQSPG